MSLNELDGGGQKKGGGVILGLMKDLFIMLDGAECPSLSVHVTYESQNVRTFTCMLDFTSYATVLFVFM